jgi:hypothetical protein
VELSKVSLSPEPRAADQAFSPAEAGGRIVPVAAAIAVPQPAAPQLPAAVGWLMLLAYAASMGTFLLFFGGSGPTAFVIAIGFFFLAVYAAVPFAFLRMQPRHGAQPTWARFLDRGLDTWTGHLSGRQALFQIMAIPVALAIAVVGIGLAAHFAH